MLPADPLNALRSVVLSWLGTSSSLRERSC